MQKLFAIKVLFVMLILFFKKGEGLKCFICRSDKDHNCGSKVSLSYSKECPPKKGSSEVYCRKISQILKFKNEKKPTLIRECAYEKGNSPCYRFGWSTIAKQITCECKKENCNCGKNNAPNSLTIMLVCSLLWIFNFLNKDHN